MGTSNAVFRKSAKGVEAVATRRPAMAPRLRALLIMVDGVRSAASLAGFVQPPASVDSLLAELEGLGMVDRMQGVGVAQPPATTSPVAVALSASAAGGGDAAPPSLALVQRHAARALISLLGPEAQPLCLKIEASVDLPTFVESVKRARDVVHGMRGADIANRFTDGIEAFMQGR